jgi:hypothetical protein
MANKKSDVKAKRAYVEILKSKGFDAAVMGSPADIKATLNGEAWYFEIKMTKREDVYFGAATLTEWRQALADPTHFRFVVAITNEEESEFQFIEYTPEEFMKYSTIPPFKVYFNINLTGKERRKRESRKSSSKKMTEDNFEKMNRCYAELKE